MSTPTVDSLKTELMSSNQEFRELVKEHQRYETRLGELASLPFPSEEEQLEEVTLKKKKLQLKDKMEMILQSYKKNSSSH